MLAGHASGCLLSALGAGMPYNREKNESKNYFYYQWHIFYLNSKPSSNSSLTKVVSLQTAGSTQGTGLPSISGQNSGTFVAALRGALRGWGKLFKT